MLLRTLIGFSKKAEPGPPAGNSGRKSPDQSSSPIQLDKFHRLSSEQYGKVQSLSNLRSNIHQVKGFDSTSQDMDREPNQVFVGNAPLSFQDTEQKVSGSLKCNDAGPLKANLRIEQKDEFQDLSFLTSGETEFLTKTAGDESTLQAQLNSNGTLTIVESPESLVQPEFSLSKEGQDKRERLWSNFSQLQHVGVDGESTWTQLQKLKQQPIAAKLSREKLLSDLNDDISIVSKTPEELLATDTVGRFAKSLPSDFARLAGQLASPEGKADFLGLELTRPDGFAAGELGSLTTQLIEKSLNGLQKRQLEFLSSVAQEPGALRGFRALTAEERKDLTLVSAHIPEAGERANLSRKSLLWLLESNKFKSDEKDQSSLIQSLKSAAASSEATLAKELDKHAGFVTGLELQAGNATTKRSSLDSRPDWTVQGNWSTRSYQDKDGSWQEAINGKNRWRVRLDAQKDAQTRGPRHELEVQGPNGMLQVDVVGASSDELGQIKNSLLSLPPEMRVHTGTITVADKIGEILDLDTGRWKGRIAGLGGGNGIILDRSQLHRSENLDHVLYHEMGHVKDAKSGRPSSRAPWGDGHSVSDYGKLNGLEDYAEMHRFTLQNLDFFSQSSRQELLARPNGQKIVEILDSYKFQYRA